MQVVKRRMKVITILAEETDQIWMPYGQGISVRRTYVRFRRWKAYVQIREDSREARRQTDESEAQESSAGRSTFWFLAPRINLVGQPGYQLTTFTANLSNSATTTSIRSRALIGPYLQLFLSYHWATLPYKTNFVLLFNRLQSPLPGCIQYSPS